MIWKLSRSDWGLDETFVEEREKEQVLEMSVMDLMSWIDLVFGWKGRWVFSASAWNGRTKEVDVRRW